MQGSNVQSPSWLDCLKQTANKPPPPEQQQITSQQVFWGIGNCMEQGLHGTAASRNVSKAMAKDTEDFAVPLCRKLGSQAASTSVTQHLY